VALGDDHREPVSLAERVSLTLRIVRLVEFRTAEAAMVEQVAEFLPQGICLSEVSPVVRGFDDTGAAAVDFHVASAAQQDHPVDRKLHVRIVAYFAVGDHRFGERGFEQIAVGLAVGRNVALRPAGIPALCCIAADMNKIGEFRRLIGGTFEPESQAFVMSVTVEFAGHLAFGCHQSGKGDGVTVRWIAAGRGGVAELVEKDRIGSEFSGEINVPFQDFDPTPAGRAGNSESLVSELAQVCSGVAEVIELAVFAAVSALDRDACTFSRTVVVCIEINQLSVEVENQPSAPRLNLTDIAPEVFKSSLCRVGRIDGIAGIHSFGGPAEKKNSVEAVLPSSYSRGKSS